MFHGLSQCNCTEHTPRAQTKKAEFQAILKCHEIFAENSSRRIWCFLKTIFTNIKLHDNDRSRFITKNTL